MNEIIKGMANAAEAIQENFTEQGEKITAVEQNIELTKIIFSNNAALKAEYIAMRDGEVRVVYAWNVTMAQGWPQDRSTGNACLLVKVSNDYGLAIANSGEIGQWYSSGDFVWR